MRSNNKLDLRLPMFIALCLIVTGLLLRVARADEWTPPDHPCTPTLSDYHHAYAIEGGVVAAVWWCDQPAGLETRWISGTAPGAITPMTQAQALIAIAGSDPLELLKKAIVRESTPSEMALVVKIELAHQPHCYVIGTAATAAVLTQTAQGTLGPPKLDAAGVGIRVVVAAPVGCNYRLAKETSKRYCSAENLTDTKVRRIEGDAWIACKIERAPAGGWPK